MIPLKTIYYWLFQPSHKQDKWRYLVIFFDVFLPKLGIEQVYFLRV